MYRTDLLDNYLILKKAKAEELRKTVQRQVVEALNKLSKNISFKKAYLFGSILSSCFREDSDVDIAFEGIRDQDFFKAIAFLSNHLERDVDIIQLEVHRFREKLIKQGLLVYNSEDYKK